MAFLVILRVETDQPRRARELAVEAASLLAGRFPEFDPHATRFGPEGDPRRRAFVLCGRKLGEHRCARPVGHTTEHSPEAATG